jgi:hypothetical protein
MTNLVQFRMTPSSLGAFHRTIMGPNRKALELPQNGSENREKIPLTY